MKALTLHQPWASLIAYGAPSILTDPATDELVRWQKTIETRTWRSLPRGLVGKPLAIHAGKRTPKPEELAAYVASHSIDWSRVPMPLGAVLAVATVQKVAHLSVTDRFSAMWVGLLDSGRWGIFLKDIRALSEPLPISGAQGLWSLEDELVKEVAL